MHHSGPENLKKSRPKKVVKSNKSISRKKVWPNFIFCNFKNGQKSIFEQGKSFKLPKIQLHEIDLLDFKSFFAWTFLNFLARYAEGPNFEVNDRNAGFFNNKTYKTFKPGACYVTHGFGPFHVVCYS